MRKIIMSKVDKTNMPFIKSMKDEEVYNRIFSCGFLLQTSNYPLLKDLKEKVLATYKVTATFRYLGYNGREIQCNGQTLVYRGNKSSNYSLGKNVKEIKSNLRSKGGSNKYPTVAHQGAKITLEFISYGLPCVSELNGWSIEVLKMEIYND